MVLYLVESDVPQAAADSYVHWLATHVSKVLAAMGRSAVGARARRVDGGADVRVSAFYELPSIEALESYLMSRERADLAEETTREQPEAKLLRSFGERIGAVKRGVRFGEEPGAAFAVRIELPAGDADAWLSWYEGEHMAQVLADKGFVRGRLYELGSDDDSVRRFLAVYDAVDLDAISAFREGDGPKLAEDHQKRHPTARIERQVWEWLA